MQFILSFLLSTIFYFVLTAFMAAFKVGNVIYFGIYGLAGLICIAMLYFATVVFILYFNNFRKKNKQILIGIIIGSLLGIVLNLTLCYKRAASCSRVRFDISEEHQR